MLHVRRLCEAASGSLTGVGEGEDAISLVRLDKSATLTLSEFLENQRTQAETALQQLKALRGKIVELVWEACAVSSSVNSFVY